ncbi:MAG: class I SAM-dependent methyltransferase [bacterium]
MKTLISKEDVLKMSYTDFIGFVNQWNVLPGAYITLSKWAVFSNLHNGSRVVDLACTSGFSSRELAILTGCSGVGVDISKPSIEIAQYNKTEYAQDIDVEYIHADACAFEPKEKFSHVIIGSALKFFPNPQVLIDRIVSTYLIDGGVLLASPFYVTKNIPKDLIERARSVFGITVTTENYKDIMKMYSGFEVLYEDRCTIIKETDKELRHYCDSTINRACAIRNISDPIIKQAMYDRIMEIKRMSNDLRPYQMYSVLILRYRSCTYPCRYTELF